MPFYMAPSIRKKTRTIKESDLYLPVKSLLTKQGYEVKGEVKGCDVLARRDDILVAVEMKLTLNLTLLLQANERADSVDNVYIALPADNAQYRRSRRSLFKLLRKLGFGLIVVGTTFKQAEVALDPGPYIPRRQKKKRGRLLKEFEELVGDPNAGGSSNRVRRVTAYRQKAVRIASHLLAHGETKASHMRDALQIENARDVMYQNHYGWFDAMGNGIYTLTERGLRELPEWLNLISPDAR